MLRTTSRRPTTHSPQSLSPGWLSRYVRCCMASRTSRASMVRMDSPVRFPGEGRLPSYDQHKRWSSSCSGPFGGRCSGRLRVRTGWLCPISWENASLHNLSGSLREVDHSVGEACSATFGQLFKRWPPNLLFCAVHFGLDSSGRWRFWSARSGLVSRNEPAYWILKKSGRWPMLKTWTP